MNSKETSINVDNKVLVIEKWNMAGNMGNLLHLRYRFCAIRGIPIL